MCLIRSAMQFQLDLSPPPERPLDMAGVMHVITTHSARPRYTFMVLDLIARIAGADGSAGPYVREGEKLVAIREWLASVISPTATRHPCRRSTTSQVRRGLEAEGLANSEDAAAQIEARVKERTRMSGMTAVSRAVSELVRAGLLSRHYQGYRVDHENRGAQRLAVYSVPSSVRTALNHGKAA